ncbi:cyclin-D1-binding protein 1 homolog [Schistocerca cancellata]|uniref:cyclin-D1-binding protein 1 homolog n=1 Tax=Schistocerca cancellata TaxID=274614 RepID=UPI0021198881|nr:cyclin-D1-binding protein 1 homolog [Schistocerca cancellata]
MAEENVFHSILEALENNLREIESGDSKQKETEIFSLDGFWLAFCLTTKSLSNEITKLCMLYSKPPLPSMRETLEILKTIEGICQNLIEIFYTLPKAKGIVLRKEVQKSVIKLLQSVTAVLNSLKDATVKSQKDRLKLVGWIWEACGEVENLPRDNKGAVCQLLTREELLLLDALQEIEGEVKADWAGEANVGEEVDNTVNWNNQDRELLPPCVGLVKTAQKCVKRIGSAARSNSNCETDQNIAQLDDLATLVQGLSPIVDDFVSSVYPPMNRNAVKTEALKVAKHLQLLLQLAKNSHYVSVEDHTWLNFLLKAVDYNNNKLQPILAP